MYVPTLCEFISIFLHQILIFINSCVLGDIIYSVMYNLPHIHIVPMHTKQRPAKRPTTRCLTFQ